MHKRKEGRAAVFSSRYGSEGKAVSLSGTLHARWGFVIFRFREMEVTRRKSCVVRVMMGLGYIMGIGYVMGMFGERVFAKWV